MICKKTPPNPTNLMTDSSPTAPMPAWELGLIVGLSLLVVFVLVGMFIAYANRGGKPQTGDLHLLQMLRTQDSVLDRNMSKLKRT